MDPVNKDAQLPFANPFFAFHEPMHTVVKGGLTASSLFRLSKLCEVTVAKLHVYLQAPRSATPQSQGITNDWPESRKPVVGDSGDRPLTQRGKLLDVFQFYHQDAHCGKPARGSGGTNFVYSISNSDPP
jgi:hypothetical protein